MSVSIVFLFAGGLFMYFAHQTGYTMLEKQAQAKGHGVIEFGKAILEYIMLSGKNDQLQNALQRAVWSGEAKDVLILDDNGIILMKANGRQYKDRIPIEQFKKVSKFPDDLFMSINEHDSLYEFVISPILKKPECYDCHTERDKTKGYIAAKISMSDIRSASVEHRTMNIFMTVVTFLGIGGILFIALLYLVVRPIHKLRNQITKSEHQIDQLEHGEQIEFTELEVPSQEDEITDLMKAFNKLIKRLNEGNKKLHELHQGQLEQADRLATTGEMAASIAHEIKNPIAGVLGVLQVFDGDIPKDDARKDIITEMMVQLERVNQAVNDLLSYARPTPPTFEAVLLNDLIQKTVSLLSQQTKKKHISIDTSFDDESIVISADRKQIQQVLWNIMLNSIQAIDMIGKLSVSITQSNSSVEIRIIDSGKGIPQKQLSDVFKPFFTTKHKGTGLGMTISKRIIEQHGGSINLESTVGKGTIVTIHLPKN